MLTASLDRLIWKETRTLAGLWLLLLALVLLMLGMAPLVDMVMNADVGGQANVVVLVLTACFAIAGAAVVFCGETEEGTREWLQQLPIRPRDLIGAKLGVLLLAQGTFLAAGLAIVSGGAWLSTATRLQQPDPAYLRSVAGCLAWGIFWSLRGKRVMSVVGWAIACELAAQGIVGNVLADGRADRVPIFYGTIVGLVAVADGWLAWRWARRGDLSFAHIEERTGLWRNGLARFWLMMLRRGATFGSPVGRWLGVVLWREVRMALPVVVGWFVATAVCAPFLERLLATAFSIKPADSSQVGAGTWFGLTWLLFGWMTSRGQWRGAEAGFLAIHGVSPRAVWWTRQTLWIAIALLLTASPTLWYLR